jgi:MYXO-CTERM domain-containing protein
MRNSILRICFCVSAGALLFPLSAAADDAGAPTCQEAVCTTDADCSVGMRCVANGGTECEPLADGGQSCSQVSLCFPTLDTSCNQDSDCGDGYSCDTQQGGQFCDCGDASIDIPSDAVKTPCSSVPEPPFCGLDAGDAGGCPPPICKAGSSCLCWKPKMCLLTPTPACTTAADCPSHFTCTSGACQPPCADSENFGAGTGVGSGTATASGTATSTSPGGTKPKAPSTPDVGATSSASGGGCAVVPGSESGAMGVGLVALGLALAARRRRTHR